MSTPIVGAIYSHRAPLPLMPPVLFRVLSANEQHAIVRPVHGRRRLPIEVTRHHFDRCFTLVDSNDEPDDLLAVAEAVGVVVVVVDVEAPIPFRPAGQQPAVEFSDGPSTLGPLLSDERLARFIGGGESA